MKRRAFLTGVGVLLASALAPIRWALAAVKKKVTAPRISRIGQVFSLSTGSGSWPSYAEAY